MPLLECTIELVETARGLENIRDDWNRLLKLSPSNSIFLTWEWIATWWQVYGIGHRPFVLLARSADGSLVGIAPLFRIKRRMLGDIVRFIGSGRDVTPEHLDFIIKPGWEPSVMAGFARQLRSDPSVREIDLKPFLGESTNLDLAAGLLATSGGSLRKKEYSVCPYLPLPSTIEQFATSRSKNYRKKMGEYQRRCDRLGAVVRQTSSRQELERDMPALVALHRRRWKHESRAFQSSEYAAFHAKLAPRFLELGWLRLFVLETNGAALAALYCFSYAGRYSFYQAGRDPDHEDARIGLVLMHHVIEEAIREGCNLFDFLRGQESYKYRWATAQFSSQRLVHRSGLVAALAIPAEFIPPIG